MSQILSDLALVADPGPHNAHMLDRVAARIKVRLNLDETIGEIEYEIRQHCRVTDSPEGPVLRGWALRTGGSREPQ